MNQRKVAFEKGLRSIKARKLSPAKPAIAPAQKMRYNGRTMLATNQIVQGDSIQLLNESPEGWVDLCFADPPFNIGYLYHGYDDEKDVAEYVEWSEKWMRAVYRALKPTGSFYLAIGDEFAADLAVIARRKIGFHLRNWIVWHYTFGQQTKKMFAKSHTHILYFSKQKPEPGMTNITFNADAIRVKSARQTTYDDARANPKGKLPDDTWYLRPQEAGGKSLVEPDGRVLTPEEAAAFGYFGSNTDVWNESRVCGTFKEREGWHGCQMPIGVLNRIIQASSNPGDVVLDPFNGSGTTVVSAALLGRKYLGIDQSAEYVGYAQKRLAHALEAGQKVAKTSGALASDEASLFVTADGNRASRVMTETDAFGRKRVARVRNGKAMRDSRVKAKAS